MVAEQKDRRGRLRMLAVAASAGVVLTALTGCVNNAAESPAQPKDREISVDESAAAMLPADIAEAGKVVVGVDSTYPPNEYKDPEGNPTGWAVDLVNAAGKKLGIGIDYQVAIFESIIPGLEGDKYGFGLASFFATVERQKKVDMVTYAIVGTQWFAQAGKTVDPDAACGLGVAVQTGTTQATEDLPAKSAECEKQGEKPIEVLTFATQDEVVTAVTLGKADAAIGDSPVAQYAVKQSKEKLALMGDAYDTIYYGMPVSKRNPELSQALQAAIQSLIDDGTYAQILTDWGVDASAIEKSEINAVL